VCFEQVPETRLTEGNVSFVVSMTEPLVAQGRLDEARRLLSLYARLESSADEQERMAYRGGEIVILREEGRDRELLEAAEEVLTSDYHQPVKLVCPRALAEALETFERLEATPWLDRVANLTGAADVPTLQRQ